MYRACQCKACIHAGEVHHWGPPVKIYSITTTKPINITLSETVHDRGPLTFVYAWDITLLNTQYNILIFRFFFMLVYSPPVMFCCLSCCSSTVILTGVLWELIRKILTKTRSYAPIKFAVFFNQFLGLMYFANVPVSGVQLFNYITNLHEVYVFLSGGNSEKGFTYIRQIMTDNHYTS